MGPYKPLRTWVDDFIPSYMEMSWELIDPGTGIPVSPWKVHRISQQLHTQKPQTSPSITQQQARDDRDIRRRHLQE